MPTILEGISLGLVLACLIGPVFFSLIDLSIRKGFVPALFLAIGISLNDILFVFLSNGLTALIGVNTSFMYWMGLIGGIVLIVYGGQMLLKKPVKESLKENISYKQNTSYIIKGFVLNGINPFVWMYWIGIAGILDAKGTYMTIDKIIFFTGTISTVFATDVLKIKLASYLRQYITPLFLKRLNAVLASGIILFGIKLLYDTLTKLQ